jgi:uncharacterized protein (TIGR02145 family)
MVAGVTGQTDNATLEKYCYNNEPLNCPLYGGLYQWDEAMQYVATPGARGICPPGWHIPTYAEFQTLSSTVGGDGNGLKAVGEGAGGGTGTNGSGFSALLAGSRSSNGGFYTFYASTYLWSSTENDATSAFSLYMYGSDNVTYLTGVYRFNGYSVRCLAD